MRKLRNKLSDEEQYTASYNLLANIKTQPWFLSCKNIALYLPNDGEIDPTAICLEMWQHKKNCYLPVLHPWQKRQLWFLPFTPSTHLTPNHFGILEPTKKQATPFKTSQLDLVLVPLVAFDKKGGRLGMGGGFYDTTFSFKNRFQHRQRPRLIGIAHSFQKVDMLNTDSWDVPLDGVITDQGVITY